MYNVTQVFTVQVGTYRQVKQKDKEFMPYLNESDLTTSYMYTCCVTRWIVFFVRKSSYINNSRLRLRLTFSLPCPVVLLSRSEVEEQDLAEVGYSGLIGL